MDIELCSFSSLAAYSDKVPKNIRIELCSNFVEGGLSPSPATFLETRKKIRNTIYVMIRTRGGDFHYSSEEFELMKSEIQWFKDHGADGFVVGLLHKDGSVDIARTKELVEFAKPLEVTFHRAFDMTSDLNIALEDVIKTGCTRILSSGGKSNVEFGYNTLKQLLKQANGRIDIMPGGGVSVDNVQLFMDAGFENIHLSSKKIITSKMSYKAKLSMTAHPSISSFDYVGVDVKKLNSFISYVQQNL